MVKIYLFLFMMLSGVTQALAFDQEFVLEKIQQGFQREDPVEILQGLNIWSEIFPDRKNESKCVQGFILAGLGFEAEGRAILLEHLAALDLPSVEKGWFLQLFDFIANQNLNSFQLLKCNHSYQPFGLKMKYWIGAGSLLLGVALLPICPAASGFLVTSGIGTLVDVVPEMLDNKIKYDQGLPPFDREFQQNLEKK